MTLETVLTMLLYVAAGWIALDGIKTLQEWWEHRRSQDLMTGLLEVVMSTIAIAYLEWWPLLLVLTWRWMAKFIYGKETDYR